MYLRIIFEELPPAHVAGVCHRCGVKSFLIRRLPDPVYYCAYSGCDVTEYQTWLS